MDVRKRIHFFVVDAHSGTLDWKDAMRAVLDLALALATKDHGAKTSTEPIPYICTVVNKLSGPPGFANRSSLCLAPNHQWDAVMKKPFQ